MSHFSEAYISETVLARDLKFCVCMESTLNLDVLNFGISKYHSFLYTGVSKREVLWAYFTLFLEKLRS